MINDYTFRVFLSALKFLTMPNAYSADEIVISRISLFDTFFDSSRH